MEMLLRPVQFIVEKMAEQLLRPIGRQFGYLVHYKENIEKLDEENREIGDNRGGVQRKVDEAKDRGEIVEDNVRQWLTDVDQKKQEVDQFLGKQRQEHKRCFHFCSRYSVSKEAKKKIDALIKLKNTECKFERISRPAPHPEFGFQSSADYMTFESRESIFNQIMEALKNNNVNLIGIYGIGGVGKTTMVEEVGKQVKKDGIFAAVVMVVVSQNVKIKQIQGQLADQLGPPLEKEEEVGRAGELWNRLNNGKRKLVILDDVWEELNLKHVGIPISDGVKGCCILLTSRIQGVCQRMGVREPFSLGVLSPLESWALFKKTVGNSVDTPNIPSIAEEVCKECGNLPVAILAVAAALKDKEEFVWADALQQLRDSEVKNIEGVDSKVYSSLELSYNFLQWEDAKWCFLLCCLFPEDSEISIDNLVRHGMGMRVFGQNTDTLEKARNRVHTLVGTLKTSCLLLEGTRDQNSVKIHDVIRDVAISIAREKKLFVVNQGVRLEEWPKEDVNKCCRVISLRYENIVQYPHVLECLELHCLMVGVNKNSITIPNDFFNGIRDLKVLDLSYRQLQSLPSSLSNLSNLRMLCLRDCEFEDISILGDLKNLEMLEVGGSLIKKLPLEIRHLTRLRLLDLRSCISLEVIPPNVISRLSRLEELYLPKQFGGWEVEATKIERRAASVGELEKLSQLTSLEIYIPNEVSFLPKEVPFQKLTRFNISVGKIFAEDFEYYPEILNYTKMLNLGDITLKDEFKVLLEKTEELRLVGMKGLEKLLHRRDKVTFTGLKSFRGESCDGIRHFFSSPVGRDDLVQLQRLKISNCKNMEEIIGNDQREAAVVFKELKTMKLQELPNLRSFYLGLLKPSSSSSTPTQALFNEKVAFHSLEDLTIVRLPRIGEIWDNQSESFSQLKELEVGSCDNLRNVLSFSMARKLVHLQETRIGRYRGQGEESNDEIVNFPTLKTLCLEHLPKLKSFCNFKFKEQDEEDIKDNDNDTLEAQFLFNQKVTFPALERLVVDGLDCIREIWANKLAFPALKEESFSQLKYLCVKECPKLVNVAPANMLPRLRYLKELEVDGCKSVLSLVEGAAMTGKDEQANDDEIIFPQLRTLKLKGLSKQIISLQSFFNHKVAFHSLEDLSIMSLPGIGEIWDNQSESFSQLRQLYVSDCDNLRNVLSFSVARNLVHLQQIMISSCRGQGEESNDEIVNFPTLSRLTLRSLPKLKSFCSFESKEQDEEEVDNNETVGTQLFNQKVAFHSLEDLSIVSLPGIGEIWDNQSESFSQLRQLHVSDCDNLRNVLSFSVARNLVHLQQIMISSCRGQGEESNDEIVNFPTLSRLTLWSLPKLKSFCSFESKEQDEEEVDNNETVGTQLFNQKVAFHSLEDLSIVGLPGIGEIWDNQSESFSQLRQLLVSDCDNLRNVLSFSVTRNLVHLQQIMISSCRGQGEESNDEIVNFPTLSSLTLWNLPKLKSFCSFESKEQDEEEVDNNETVGTQLFNQKVAFHSLEDLSIVSLPGIGEIWDNQSESFSQLRQLRLHSCDNLRNVLSFSMARKLVHLQEIRIGRYRGQGEESNDEIVNFPALSSLTLWSLPKLKSFCSFESKEQDEEEVNNNETVGTQLFNQKVAFHSLEDLTIVRLPRIGEIWDNQSESFSQLRELEVGSCDNLRNVLSFSMARKLVHLQETRIGRYRGQGEESNDEIVNFPTLKTLCLEHLPKLKSFCNFKFKEQDEEDIKDNDNDTLEAQFLFNQKVTFPALERLVVDGLDCIREIWANKLAFPALKEESFSQLKYLCVKECPKLVNVAPANMLPRLRYLKELEVDGCKSVLSLVEGAAMTGKDEQANDDEIIFPQLRTLKLKGLSKQIISLQSFFNYKVAFPSLEDLSIDSMPSIGEIWDKQSESFSQLKSLVLWNLPKLKSFCNSRAENEEEGEVKDKDTLQSQLFFNEKVTFPLLKKLCIIACHSVTTLFSANSLQRLQNIGKLTMKSCHQMRVVFDLGAVEGLNVGKRQVEIQHALRVLHLHELPALNCIWNKDPNRIMSFQLLEKVTISKCGLLKNLFSSSVARTLEKLQGLAIDSCIKMETIVETQETEELTDEIVFPQLKVIMLDNLPNLTSFCDANYAFNVPSLRQAKLISCPKMQTFTFGQLNMPNIKIYANKDQWVWGHDLNKYIKQHVLKEKESTLVDGKDDDISNASSDNGDNDFDSDEMTFDWSDSDIGSTDQDGDGNSIIDDNGDNEYSGDVGSSENSNNIVDNNGHNDDGGDLQLQN